MHSSLMAATQATNELTSSQSVDLEKENDRLMLELKKAKMELALQ
jgi:hypothetical protein